MDASVPAAPQTTQWLERVRQQAFSDQLAAWSCPLYFALFSLGALLLLIPVFVSGGDKPGAAPVRAWLHRSRAHLRIAGGIILMMLCAVSQQTGIDRSRGFISDQDRRYEAFVKKVTKEKGKEEALRAQYLYLPEGNSLVYMSLGNPSLAADYVWLTSLQYVSSAVRRGHKFELLNRFYSTLADLDPYWTEAEVNAGKVLSALEQNRFLVEKFYTNAMVKNPGSAELPYEAGRLFVVPPLDPRQQSVYSKRAVVYFQLTRERLLKQPRTGANKALIGMTEDMIARLSVETDDSGFNEVADSLFYERATNKDNPSALRQIAARDWLNAHSLVIVDRLQRGVNDIRQRTGLHPPSLEPVFKALPGGENYRRDAFGFAIEYDAQPGKVFSRGIAARRAIQVHAVITSLLMQYRSEHNDQPPASLRSLSLWLRTLYNQRNPPGSMVLETLGSDFECETGPLGKWEYNPQEGCIVLPPYCAGRKLFKNAEKLWKDE